MSDHQEKKTVSFSRQYQVDKWNSNLLLLRTYFAHPTPRLDSVWWFWQHHDPTHTREENEAKAFTVILEEQEKVLDYQETNALLKKPRPLPGTIQHKEHFTTDVWMPFTYREKRINSVWDLEFGPYTQHYA